MVEVALWAVSGVLACAFMAAGLLKLTQPRPRLVASGMGWAAATSDAGVKALGVAEVLGALGLVLPAATGVLPWLTPLAAIALALAMAGAVVVHLRRGERGSLAPPLALGVACALVALLRLGPYPG